MNFMGGRQGIYDEEQMLSGNKGKLPSSQYSSSSSPSSSPSQHQKVVLPCNYQSGWMDNKFEGGSQLELLNNDGTGSGTCVEGDVVVEREHMFDKVVTPSDVGKLNRLVIPKQHAERYFPLDSSTNEKGLLLNFEDRNGKPWRFRYSYWNSSQSYVMTKGWSRFVKEKKLDAGDIVSFQRGIGELAKDRLFIDWRRRPDAPELNPSLPPSLSFPHNFSFHRSIHPWNPLFLQSQVSAPPRYYQPNTPQSQSQAQAQSHPINNSYSYGSGAGGGGPYGYNTTPMVNPCSGSVIYFRSAAPQQVGMMQMQRGGSGVEPVVFESVPVVQGKAAAKRLRLFGVNMECPITESDECDILSSTTIPHNATMPPHFSSTSSSSIPYLQLRPYNGTPLPSSDFFNKGKGSMSLDLDI